MNNYELKLNNLKLRKDFTTRDDVSLDFNDANNIIVFNGKNYQMADRDEYIKDKVMLTDYLRKLQNAMFY